MTLNQQEPIVRFRVGNYLPFLMLSAKISILPATQYKSHLQTNSDMSAFPGRTAQTQLKEIERN
jgi:hypothetical protein